MIVTEYTFNVTPIVVKKNGKKKLGKRSLVAFDCETESLRVGRSLSIRDPILPHDDPQLKEILATLYGDEGSDNYDAHHYVRHCPTGQAHSLSDFETIAQTTQSPQFSQAFREPPLPFDWRKYWKPL